MKSSIESFKKRVTEHKEWIKDPKKKYGEKWDTFSKERKEREIHHWEQDIKRNEANQVSHEEALKRVEK
ncbi:MAG: hypothetical protein NVV59_00080 [Chitinophagaceae bacterium]|nr:hypothetical protein [Chitinophagaceae bacterium]